MASRHTNFRFVFAFLLVGGWCVTLNAQGERRPEQPSATPVQVLAEAERQGEYAFLVFFRQQDQATKAMADSVARKLKSPPHAAVSSLVAVGDPANSELVAKFGAGRAPMPLLVAVAPNGAVTGVFPQCFNDAEFRSAFVTPCMMRSIKALQDEKLVFICVKPSEKSSDSSALTEFAQDPLFKNRMVVLSLVASDAAESEFLRELQLAPSDVRDGQTVVMAPPGALVGTFPVTTSKDEIARAIADAGKCCDDPNCKNHRSAQGKKPRSR